MSRPLLVIDLNGVLLDRRVRRLEGATSLGRWGQRYAYARPHASDFVAWAADSDWRVGIWTSATRRNAAPLARAVLGDTYARVHFLYTQEECEQFKQEGSARPTFKKPLARLWRKGLGLPGRTVLLDDGKDKLCEGEEDNALLCPHYDASADGEDAALAPGGWLRTALVRIMAAEDVRDVIVQHY